MTCPAASSPALANVRSTAWVALVVAAVCATGACTKTVQVRTEDPQARLTLDGRQLGEVPPAGVPVEVGLGLGPVAYELHVGDARIAGQLARTEPVWWLVAAGVGGALCCAPTLALGGCCLANPGALAAPLAFSVAGDLGALLAPCVAPSWFTLPLVTGCGVVGASPLGLVFLAESLPEEIVIPSADPRSAKTGEMGF